MEGEDESDANWPDYYPDSCPPADAVPAAGTFYRLVDENPCITGDFRSVQELVQAGEMDARTHADLCLLVGLSLNSDLAEITRLRGSFGRMRQKHIAKGTITGSGLMKATGSQTQPNHHTWWRPFGDEAWKTFAVAG